MPNFQSVRRIACIGEVMIELTGDGPDRAKVGVAGDTYNTAVYLVRLIGDDCQVSYVTALGVDRFSENIVSHMTANGVDTSCIERRDDRMPGLYAIETDDEGERSFAYWRSESAARTLFSAPATITFETLAAFDLIYLSGITLAILPESTRQSLFAFLRQFRSDGGLVAYDSNFRARLWPDIETARSANQEMYACTDLAMPSLDDEVEIFGKADPDAVVSRVTKAGVRLGAVTHGKNKLSPIPPSTPSLVLAPVPRVVDTTAAGDSFNAGVIAGLIGGDDLRDALEAGHNLAVKVLGHEGAICPA